MAINGEKFLDIIDSADIEDMKDKIFILKILNSSPMDDINGFIQWLDESTVLDTSNVLLLLSPDPSMEVSVVDYEVYTDEQLDDLAEAINRVRKERKEKDN